MFGAIAKTYYADKMGIPRDKMFCCFDHACIAKKYECQRPEMNSSGYQDVDVVLTTRELAKMIRMAGLDFNFLPEEEFDHPLGLGSGAGAIFGTSGGVMELQSVPYTKLLPEKNHRASTYCMQRS